MKVMLKIFEIYSEEGPESRRGKLAVKYYLKWKTDHLPECFVILRNGLTNEFLNVCHTNKYSVQTSCHKLKNYFLNNCDDEDHSCLASSVAATKN